MVDVDLAQDEVVDVRCDLVPRVGLAIMERHLMDSMESGVILCR